MKLKCKECKEEIGPFAPFVWNAWIIAGQGDPGKLCCKCLDKKAKEWRTNSNG